MNEEKREEIVGGVEPSAIPDFFYSCFHKRRESKTSNEMSEIAKSFSRAQNSLASETKDWCIILNKK
jgi:hypothetical protein